MIGRIEMNRLIHLQPYIPVNPAIKSKIGSEWWYMFIVAVIYAYFNFIIPFPVDEFGNGNGKTRIAAIMMTDLFIIYKNGCLLVGTFEKKLEVVSFP
jgi:hypothetical protein